MKIELTECTSIPQLMRWRKEVLSTVFGAEPDRQLLDANRRYYESQLPVGGHLAIVVTADGVGCGCGAVCFYDEMPSPDNLSGHCAYLMNIYVRPQFRKHGIAHHIVRRLIHEARLRDCRKIYLETTADGRNVYLSLGFKDMDDMLRFNDKNKN
ncbi:MAG: GNAT family N-acetyltransferase [Bacteroides sp.]|nr:GNAT family N-acetyltransferase [Bacteroides sp.]MCM1413208.1 GNAT family N-acetyltransferase [Bacteroides sp.]MCM1472050.1 GNAT family N-acetyltransferase [Bacteroides sp.]